MNDILEVFLYIIKFIVNICLWLMPWPIWVLLIIILIIVLVVYFYVIEPATD
jgi:hypothetical protein